METFPTVEEAVKACRDSAEEVVVLNPEADGVSQIRTIVDVVKYAAPKGGIRALVLTPATLNPGAQHALARVLEDPPAHVRLLAVG